MTSKTGAYLGLVYRETDWLIYLHLFWELQGDLSWSFAT